MNEFNEDIKINKKVSNKTHKDDTDVYIHSFTPMLETLQNMNKNDNSIADSTCTRFVRKKFMCIVLLLITVMVIMNFFNTVTEKLSQENVQDIYGTMVQVMKKIPQLMTTKAKNSTNIEPGITVEYDSLG
jgi:hypothetical protein